MNKNRLLTALGVAATGVGLYLLYRVLHRYDPANIAHAIRAAPMYLIAESVAFTIGSFAAIAAMEWLAVRYTEKRVAPTRVVRTAIAALGIGHCIGLVALSSGAIRYRMYNRAGLDAVAVGEVVLFSGITVALGLASIGGAALLLRGDVLAKLLHLGDAPLKIAGWAALAVVIGYILLCAFARGCCTFWRFRLRLPTWTTACTQAVFGSLDLLFVAAALYSSLRWVAAIDYPTAASLYIGSDVSALVGHVPGGWGVFEYIVTQALRGPEVVAGVVLFRTVYFLLPFGAGASIFLYDELAGRRAVKREKRALAAHAYGR
jgi:hypothetical protein